MVKQRQPTDLCPYTLISKLMSKEIKSNDDTAEILVEDFLKPDISENPGVLLYPVNIRETDHKYELEISAPCFKKSDFIITTDGGLLTIIATTEHLKHKEDDNFTRKEFLRSSFRRAFSLPENVLVDHISGEYHDGILTVDLKKNRRFLIGKKHVKID
jgi:HSP20 family protein